MSEEVTTNEEQNPSLGIEELIGAIQAIDIACEEGAYKGWEKIQQVFAVRHRLMIFVNFLQERMEEASKSAVGEATGTAEVGETK